LVKKKENIDTNKKSEIPSCVDSQIDDKLLSDWMTLREAGIDFSCLNLSIREIKNESK